MKFKITTKDNREFISTEYKDIRHIQDNAFQYEGGVFCENSTFIASGFILLIEPLKEEVNEKQTD